jgi:hypothetical protein
MLTIDREKEKNFAGNAHQFDLPENNSIQIDIRKAIRFIVEFSPSMFVGCISGALLGLILSFIVPAQYENSAFVEFIVNPIQNILGKRGENEQVLASNPTAELSMFLKTYRRISELPTITLSLNNKLKEEGINAEYKLKSLQVPETTFLELRATGKDPEALTRVVNLWADLLVQKIGSQRAEMYQNARALLSDPYQKFNDEVTPLTAELKRLRPQLELKQVELKAKTSQLADEITELATIDARIQRFNLEVPALKEELKKHSLYEPLQSSNQDQTKPTISPDMDVDSKDSKHNLKMIGVINYGANPIHQTLQQRISEGEINLATLSLRKQQLDNSFQQHKKEVDKLLEDTNSSSLTIERLERDLNVAMNSFKAVNGKLGEAELAGTLPSSNLRVVSYGGKSAVLPYRSWFMLGGVMIGIITSFFWFFRRSKYLNS